MWSDHTVALDGYPVRLLNDTQPGRHPGLAGGNGLAVAAAIGAFVMRGITTVGQVALMTLGYRKLVIRIRKSAGLGYRCRVGQPVRGFGEPHRNPTTQRHGGRSPQESRGRNGTLRYTCYAC